MVIGTELLLAPVEPFCLFNLVTSTGKVTEPGVLTHVNTCQTLSLRATGSGLQRDVPNP